MPHTGAAPASGQVLYDNGPVNWSITSDIDGGILFGKGTAALTDSFVSVNQYGFEIHQDIASGLNVGLGADTYWLNLGNATTQQGNPLYWDENSGAGCKGDNGMGGGCPSLADCNQCLEKISVPSETFDITGTK